ncbi:MULTISPECIES: nicotinate phosphoribosyltransferase [Alkalibacterium]|jgi:nicotinate phosphoribosyltransferase|uniref:Nicotinate phosphoribosyltransferase n=2 Tax=Alkalibacterium TaxID=99906 RepID=A0A1H7EX47_9LACT|nr:nicotinate phosphoribosyltransferase [Alkalibacterium pelagium]GEN49579.1 nicotinate phosphoribosyltransferase [Alkalibacterium pelagium]SEK18431.1 nicotinate phosphoribosyltransferase [Alkalibacterium pelagium]
MYQTYADDSMALHTDFYELNMIYTHWKKANHTKKAVFEVYYRSNPFGMGYTIFAGLERVVDYITNIKFSESDIAYLREIKTFPEDFLDYLKEWRFKGTIRSFKEGEVAFANEPLIQVEGPLADCQLIETALLNIVNFQTLIATKASQIKSAAGNDPVLEFGARRAQEFDAALWGARATYIGGCDSTSNTRAAKVFGIPAAGTHAHALVQAYRDEYQAFKAYAETHKDCVFLVDTYHTLDSGVPNAIRVANEMGDKINFQGVRLDSGDLSYLSKRVRQQLDEAGYPDAKIFVSNDLNAETILNLKMQGAKIDVWGVGTKMITAYDQPALGAVYKIVSVEGNDREMHHTLKLTANAAKISTPGKKQVWRIRSKNNVKPEGDYIALDGERPDQQDELYMFHPQYTYINKTVKDFTARPLLQDIIVDGELVYDMPELEEIKRYAEESLSEQWEENKRLLNPEPYPVDLSQELYDAKVETIKLFKEIAKSTHSENDALF